MQTFIHRNSRLSGIQFDGNNRDKIIDALGMKKEYCQLWRNEDTREAHLVIKAPGMDLGRVNVKNWILIGANKSSYLVLTEESLKEEYEEL